VDLKDCLEVLGMEGEVIWRGRVFSSLAPFRLVGLLAPFPGGVPGVPLERGEWGGKESCLSVLPRVFPWLLARPPAMRCQNLVGIEAIAVYYREREGQNGNPR
jgi:hypothetical protein